MRKMFPNTYGEWVKENKDLLKQNEDTNTTEIGNNLEVDGTITANDGLNSGTAASGKVLSATGDGGTTWRDAPKIVTYGYEFNDLSSDELKDIAENSDIAVVAGTRYIKGWNDGYDCFFLSTLWDNTIQIIHLYHSSEEWTFDGAYSYNLVSSPTKLYKHHITFSFTDSDDFTNNFDGYILSKKSYAQSSLNNFNTRTNDIFVSGEIYNETDAVWYTVVSFTSCWATLSSGRKRVIVEVSQSDGSVYLLSYSAGDINSITDFTDTVTEL